MFASKDEAAGYLAGIIDGEGHVAFRRHTRPEYACAQLQRYVVITNTDLGLLNRASAALDLFGIAHRSRTRTDSRTGHLGTKPIHEVYIGQQDALKRLAETVTLGCKPKQEALVAIIGSYRAAPRYDEAATLYAELGSYRKVADELGVPYSTAALWIKSAGQPLRKPGRPLGRKWSDEERKSRLGG